MGRAPTAGEIGQIEARLSRNMRQLARLDRAEWARRPMAERLQAAAEAAAQELLGEAQKAKQRTMLRILATERATNRLTELAADHPSWSAGLVRQLEEVDAYRKGVEREYFSNMIDAIEAAQPNWFGLVENVAAVRDFAREVFGIKTGSDAAAKGAKAWLETVEAMRERFNRAGGEVRKLDYGYLPQAHDMRRVRAVPAEQWAAEILPQLDRTRYLNDDGTVMDDAATLVMLKGVHETIATDGINGLEPGKFRGTGARAGRHAEARALHFKDADSYLDYAAKYGRGTLYEMMRGHVGALARDIATIEKLGPNPEYTFRYLSDMTIKADGSEKLVGPLLVRPTDVWNVLSGYTGQSPHQQLANLGRSVRSYEVAVKLGFALLSSFNDAWTVLLTARYNRIPMGETLVNVLRGFGAESRDYANRVGLIAESIIGDMSRFSEENLRENWAGKLGNFTMKASGLNAWTNALRRGFSVSLMGSLGKLTRNDWGVLAEVDRLRLEQRGITAADWQVWRHAVPESWRRAAMLTPESVRAIPDEALRPFGDPLRVRDAAVSKLLGFITDESEYASLNPDIMTRAAVTRSTQGGTMEGEFLRSLMLFKSFPLSIISRHIRRAAKMSATEGGASGVGYAANLIVGLWLFGALSLQAKSVSRGEDPRDMTDPKFWFAALAQGGGLGIYGDVIFTGMGGENRGGTANWANLFGPVIGDAFDLGSLTLENIGQMVRGKESKLDAEFVRFARGHLPVVNLWYTRAAFDHMIFHELQESLSPGYLSKMRRRAQREFGQQYWWEPGDVVPGRAPDLAAAVGE